MMYKSPINIFEEIGNQFIQQKNKAIEDAVVEAVFNIGVTVDKEELIKALKYDREQYNKGYKDGIKEGAIRFAKKLCEYYDIDFERSGLIQSAIKNWSDKE